MSKFMLHFWVKRCRSGKTFGKIWNYTTFRINIQDFKRFRQHSKGKHLLDFKSNDWLKIWQTECKNSTEARLLEKRIKSRGAGRYLIDIGVQDSAVSPIAE